MNRPLHQAYVVEKRSFYRTPRTLDECEFEQTGSPLRRDDRFVGFVIAALLAIGFVVAIWRGLN